MRISWLLPVSLILANCGRDDPGTSSPADVNQIERLSTPRTEGGDRSASARPQPLSQEELEREGLGGAGCRFTVGGQLLLVSVGSDAAAKIDGQLRHFVQSAPVGESGGFFEDRQVSISVGRTDRQEQAVDELRSWPARLTVTNRRTERQQELRGVWSCGA